MVLFVEPKSVTHQPKAGSCLKLQCRLDTWSKLPNRVLYAPVVLPIVELSAISRLMPRFLLRSRSRGTAPLTGSLLDSRRVPETSAVADDCPTTNLSRAPCLD